MNIAARQSIFLPRIENDFYPTDDGFTCAMLATLPLGLSGPILEPCAGQRDIVHVLRQSGLQVEDTDVIDGPGMDATTDAYWADRAPDWTVTNPPFNLATKILQPAYQNSRRGVLIFLRITYLEPCPDRAEWLDKHADQLRWCQVVNPRPIFRADTNKTDSATCVWLLWDKEWSWLSQGIEPPFRFSNGSRSRADGRKTTFPPAAPKLQSFDHKFSKVIESPISNPAPDDDFDHKFSKVIENAQAELDGVLLRLGEAIDLLRDQGVAGKGARLASEQKGDQTYHRTIQGRRSKAIPAGQVAHQQAMIDRRKQSRQLSTIGDAVSALKHRLDKFRS